jgi:hypothetical protein
VNAHKVIRSKLVVALSRLSAKVFGERICLNEVLFDRGHPSLSNLSELREETEDHILESKNAKSALLVVEGNFWVLKSDLSQ